jgi:ornithine decarboxylase
MTATQLPVMVSDNAPLSPQHLLSLPNYTRPVLYIDKSTIARRYAEFKQAFPQAAIHYAMKCNPERPVLEEVKRLGCNFEIASYNELTALLKIGVNPGEVLFSNPVKSRRDIEQTYAAGVRCFAFHSPEELEKLAAYAPGANVYLRLATPIGKSTVASEGKYGHRIDTDVGRQRAVAYMQAAVIHGLVPYGLAFHVGSQMEDPDAWTTPIYYAAALMRLLEQSSNIRLPMLDIGGGFPAYHNLGIPPLAVFGKTIATALAGLPYRPDQLVLEPGRGLVSDAGVLKAEVIAREQRGRTPWLYLSIGAFNGLMEALETNMKLRFPMTDSRNAKRLSAYTVSGPSCDSQDTITSEQQLSADLTPGDHVLIYTAGAYTTAYASRFNGFETPRVVYVS